MSLSGTLGTLLALLALGLIAGPSCVAGTRGHEVTSAHQFTLGLGRDAITEIFTTLEQETESLVPPSGALRFTGLRLKNSFHQVGFRPKEQS